MKLPSLVRVPKYRRFNFEPRHFDPLKDELKNRTEKIKNDLATTGNGSIDEFAVKQRISDAFVRDRHKTGGKIAGTQVFFILLISASFVGFWYIGFPAFIITGVIIFLYILQQKGLLQFNFTKKATEQESDTEEASTNARRIAAGEMREGRFFAMNTVTAKKGKYKLMLLLATVGVAVGYYVFQLNGIMTLLMIFILLVLFIKESSKA